MFSPAGHIIGAASIFLESERNSIVFSGDVGRPNDPITPSPAIPPKANNLVLESTYGNRTHPKSNALNDIAQVVNETIKKGGVLLIPAFAVGRVQLLLHYLDEAFKQKLCQKVPVYLNSPMASAATNVFLNFQKETKLDPKQCTDAGRLPHIISSVEESKDLNSVKAPAIIIACSGMATGGRVLHHMKVFGQSPRNTILFTGYQAAGTRGAALIGGAPSLRIHGKQIQINAKVEMIDNLSAHADADELIAWLKSFKWRPNRVFLTHGEPASIDALRWRVEHELGWNCHIPYYLEDVAL